MTRQRLHAVGLIALCVLFSSQVQGGGLHGNPLTVQQGISPDAVDRLLTVKEQKACGIGSLSKAERAALGAVLARLEASVNTQKDAVATLTARLASRTDDEVAAAATYWRPAREHLEYEGYEQIGVSSVTVDGEDWIVVDGLFRRSATKDLPLGLFASTVPRGTYWCKPAIFGGIDEIIVNGSVYSFFLADWRDLRD